MTAKIIWSAPARLDNALFLMLLERFIRSGRNVSDSPTANNYAPKVFAAEPEARTRINAKPILKEAMNRLFASGQIAIEPYGPPSKTRERIIAK